MKLLREPLVHFLMLGGALFVLFALVGDTADEQVDRIVVTAARIEQFSEEFASTWQRPPTADELDDLIDRHIRDEIYFREARAMGLDRDDTIIRGRMRQKLEFLADESAAATDPTEEELREYFAEHVEVFRASPRVSFDQVFVNTDVRGEAARKDAERLLERLRNSAEEIDPSALGDPITQPSVFDGTTPERISRRFGAGFTEAVATSPVGSWSGPVESGFGLHLVRVRDREAAADPLFDDVREAVEREWRAARQEEAADAFFEGLRKRYAVEIEKEPTP